MVVGASMRASPAGHRRGGELRWIGSHRAVQTRLKHQTRAIILRQSAEDNDGVSELPSSLVACECFAFSPEVEYFWYQNRWRWELHHRLPDPCDPDPVPAFGVGLIADWPDDMLDSSGRLVLEAGGENGTFGKRNIITDTGHSTPSTDVEI